MRDTSVPESALAINGGSKAIRGFEGAPARFGMKPGVEEFLAIADTFGYSAEAQAKIRAAVEAEEEQVAPKFTRYYNPRPSRVAMFEERARQVFGSAYALGVNSGTSALMSAYVAAGVGPGTEVIVPAYTFYATAAAVVASKGIPIIAEIDDSMTIDPEDVERKITPRTKAIVPVHMVGVSANMEAIMDIARRHGLMVVEDNAQACGGKFHGRYLGTIGHLGCFSLSSYKVVGAGEAGLVLTDDEWLHTRATAQHDTAACWRPDRFAKERRPGELFCGQNYRMSELEGAINYVQLGHMEEQARRYNGAMRTIVGGLDAKARAMLRRSNDLEGDLGYNVILLAPDQELAGKMAEALRAEGLEAGARGSRGSRDWHIYTYWEQILEQKTATPEGCPFTCTYYKAPLPPYSTDMCPRAASLFGRAVFVAVNQYWTPGDCEQVVDAINKVCGAYS